MLILLYGCTTWTLTKRIEKKLDSNYTRMLRVILNKTWRQHPTKQQLYGHLPLIMKTIQVRRTRHAGYVLLWTPSHGRTKTGWSAWTYIQQLCTDTGCSPEDLLEAIDNREGWWERVRDIRADGVTWCWWDIYISKLAIVVEDNPKVLFSTATTLMYREGYYSFLWIVPLHLSYVLYSAES